jgi:hypothetical protein
MSTVKITTTKNGSFKIETHDAIIFATLEEAKQLADKLPMYIEQLERGEQANGDQIRKSTYRQNR